MKLKALCLFLLSMTTLGCLLAGCEATPKIPCLETDEDILDHYSGETVSLIVENDTCMSICVLKISPDHCEYMGGVNYVKEHRLRSEESINIELPPGKYTAWVELCTEEFRADEHINVKTGTVHVVTDPSRGSKPPCDTSLTIVNNSDKAICNMRIGITESIYTGWNWVGSDHIEPGESLFLALRPDTYFIRAESCDGDWLRSEVDVAISGDQIWTVP